MTPGFVDTAAATPSDGPTPTPARDATEAAGPGFGVLATGVATVLAGAAAAGRAALNRH
jgi:hypothetical protein